jgi:hypothetical protein
MRDGLPAPCFTRTLHRWPSPHAEFAQEFGCSILSHDGAVFFVANGMGRISYIAKPLVRHRSNPPVTVSADCRMIRARSELYELMACQENKIEIAKALRELTRSLRGEHQPARDHKHAACCDFLVQGGLGNPCIA